MKHLMRPWLSTLSITSCMALMLTGFVYAGAVTHGTTVTTTTTVTATATQNVTVTTGQIDVSFNPDYFANTYAQANYTAISSQCPNDVLTQLSAAFGAGQLGNQLAQMQSSSNPSDAEFLNANYGPGELAYSTQEWSNGSYSSGSGTTSWNNSVTDTLAIEEATIGERTATWSSSSAYLGSATVFTDAGTTTSASSGGTAGAFQVYNTSGTTSVDTVVQTNADAYQYDGSKYVSPIVLDLSGSGQLEASGGKWLPHPRTFDRTHAVAFDFYNNGFPIIMEWVGPHEGLLVEPKADGTVDGSSLFGTQGGWSNGYEKLSLRDTNHDGMLSGDELKGLAVWVDANSDGKVDAGELKSLDELGITELNLRHVGFRSSFTMNGKKQTMWDWWPSAMEVKKRHMGDIVQELKSE